MGISKIVATCGSKKTLRISVVFDGGFTVMTEVTRGSDPQEVSKSLSRLSESILTLDKAGKISPEVNK